MKYKSEVRLSSRNYWYKFVGMLQQNWALIERSETSNACRIYFINDNSIVFDSIDFMTESEAKIALKKNGFARYEHGSTDAAYLDLPPPPFFFGEHVNGKIYSSGRFWTNAASKLTPSSPTQQKRTRATVIVECDGRILLTENNDGRVFLPGGGAQRNELLIGAAARELHEETGLTAIALLHLFEHESATTQHSVYFARTTGMPVAGDDAVCLLYLEKGDQGRNFNLSPATRDIIKHYLKMQKAHPGHFS